MKLQRALRIAAVGLLSSPTWGATVNFPDCVNGPLSNNTVCDTKAKPSDRAWALVKALNLDEKLANLVEYDKREKLFRIAANMREASFLGHLGSACRRIGYILSFQHR
jgi:hypothetical protein